MITITDEQVRGCGYRKPGGLYLISDGPGTACDLLPMPLTICPCCSAGIKPSRGWTWINAKLIVQDYLKSRTTAPCVHCDNLRCIMLDAADKAGLLWVGEEFYKTTGAFITEAQKQGISRRISKLPREFKVGVTQVFLAHRKALKRICSDCDTSTDLFCPKCNGTKEVDGAGIFSVFVPQRIEYILTGAETEEELKRKEEMGITLIKLIRTDGAV